MYSPFYTKFQGIDNIEKEFEYGDDEESIFQSFVSDPKAMPYPVKRRFMINSENTKEKKLVQNVLRRFTERSQTVEFLVKFNPQIEKTDESSIMDIEQIVTGDIIDQKERRRYIRQELKEYSTQNVFASSLPIKIPPSP